METKMTEVRGAVLDVKQNTTGWKARVARKQEQER